MNDNLNYLLEWLEADLKDLRKRLEDNDDEKIILVLIKEHMIPDLERLARELLKKQ